MRRYLSCVPATFEEETGARDLPSPEASRRADRKPVAAGKGLIFPGAWSALDITRPAAAREPDEIGRAARAWCWYEWVRISLVVAALGSAALVMAGKTATERAQARAARLQPPTAGESAVPPGAQASDDSPEAVGALHYWSDDVSTTVTVDLQKLIFFEAHHLTNPDRVYFDLQDTEMPEELRNRLVQVDVSEKFVRRIRMAEWGPGVTRLVLEITPNCDYSAMIAPKPYRLVVKLRGRE